MSSPASTDKPSVHHSARPLDAAAIAIVLLLCVSWGLNQVAAKVTINEMPPLLQGMLRSVIAGVLVAGWCLVRGIPIFNRDNTLKPGLLIGSLFGIEFVLIFQGLAYTTASRSTVFLYITPFLVALGSRILLPADRFSAAQWAGLMLSFTGMVVAFGLPTPALDPRQTLGDVMILAGAVLWAGTTLTSKASRLNGTSPEKVLLYQVAISVPILALASWLSGETITHWPSPQALAALAYQSVWVVAVTFVLWFYIIKQYSASRVSAFTVLTPLFGVAAGHFILGDPLTPAFLAAVGLVALGLVLVNRSQS